MTSQNEKQLNQSIRVRHKVIEYKSMRRELGIARRRLAGKSNLTPEEQNIGKQQWEGYVHEYSEDTLNADEIEERIGYRINSAAEPCLITMFWQWVGLACKIAK